VSWQLGAFALLALALAVGFAWYERERPDARIVALVGTLAAFAALGRIAFAALPNVKPTTDIVLISGYALGGGPGFAVGALAGLTSNFFFGQGPWTPWQMAAWGATGVLGALLARAAGLWRRGPDTGARPPIGRWPLALVCCAVGFAFTAFQDLGDWVTYSDHTLSQLAVYVGKGLGFDAIHAGGCLIFALAFGPALCRSIERFARRLQVSWVRPAGTGTALLVLAGLVLPLGLGLSSPAPARAAATPVSYLLAAENSDGGFGAAPGQPSAELYTGWAALGLASAGYDLQRPGSGSHSLIAYLQGGAASLADVGSLERTILVVRAAGLSAQAFAGHDLVAELDGRLGANGSVSDQVNLTTFAILALRAADAPPANRTYAWLERQQDSDGGFGFGEAGGSSDVDDTGAVLEALAGVGGRATTVRTRALGYLRGQQNRDGGFPAQAGGESNAQSTAWAVQGLDASGVNPASFQRSGGSSPMAYLQSLIAPDGHVRYSRGFDQTPVWVTGEALMALEGKPLPLAPPPSVSTPSAAFGSPAHSGSAARGRRAARAARRRSARASSARRRAARRLARSETFGLPRVPIADVLTGAGVATALLLAPVGAG
jgi:energy-coupling factor transport system substrate-specific component